MAKISWGKPTLEIAPLNNGVAGAFTPFPTPVEGSTKLTTEKGTKLEAPLEGGELADIRYNKSKYTAELELYKTAGKSKPIPDADGVIETEYALRLTPEDPANEGWIIDRASVSVEDTWDSKTGHKWKYTFEALKPATGAILKPYAAQVLAVTPTSLAFTAAADSAGKAITATSSGSLTYAGKSGDSEWLTVTRSGKVATVKVAANANSEGRSAYVTLTADGKSAAVLVTQAGA
jgi:hypothetical protein